jgi:hypothetical protein
MKKSTKTPLKLKSIYLKVKSFYFCLFAIFSQSIKAPRFVVLFIILGLI